MLGPHLPNDQVYKVVKAWFEQKAELDAIVPIGDLTWEFNIPIYDALAKTVPIHGGMAKYLKELGKWKDIYVEGEYKASPR